MPKLRSSQVKTSSLTSILNGIDNVQDALETLDEHVQPVELGGTNLTSYTAGDILYASDETTIAKLPIGNNGKILSVFSGALSWQDPSSNILFDGYYNKEEISIIADGYYNKEEIDVLIDGYYNKEEISLIIDDYYTKQDISDILDGYSQNSDWITSPETFTRTGDGYCTIPKTAETLVIFKKGRILRFSNSSDPAVFSYNMIDAISIGVSSITITLAGTPLLASYDTLEYTYQQAKEEHFYFDGYFAISNTSDLLNEYNRRFWNTNNSTNYILKFQVYQKTDDSTAQPQININSSCSEASNAGITLTNSAIISTEFNIRMDYREFSSVYIQVLNNGTGNAEDLSLKLIYISV